MLSYGREIHLWNKAIHGWLQKMSKGHAHQFKIVWSHSGWDAALRLLRGHMIRKSKWNQISETGVAVNAGQKIKPRRTARVESQTLVARGHAEISYARVISSKATLVFVLMQNEVRWLVMVRSSFPAAKRCPLSFYSEISWAGKKSQCGLR